LKRTGIIILIVGVLLTLYEGLNYFTGEKSMDMEKIEMKQEDRHNVNWLLLAGIGIIVAGGVVLVLGVNRKDEEKIFDK
jgi:uncharacterized membrane protein YidH (DUF202 family)